ncbi:rhomboid-related protein 2 isoform X2 [Marmota monax]|uniref:rhomboid-related protein 2 isoform X2 n=1 Tax=Marmota monax TaxID=9995 RepID=UPI0026EB0353|nr:rhomboid-related protein 2 isoform X2 [Marmota monax]
MAAAHDLEMESVNLNMERENKELEEEKTWVDGGGKDPPKGRKVHRIVSKWMLPEPVRKTYLERANCLPPPVFIISISLAELAVFIYYAVWKPQKQWITLDTGILESPLIYSPEKREEAWRFISYMLVHAGVQHIVGNLLMQLVLGIPLEMVHKGLRVGLVYLAGVIAGSLASSIFDPLRSLVGASGGVYALMGGYFMNVLVNFREMIPVLGIFRLLIIILIGCPLLWKTKVKVSCWLPWSLAEFFHSPPCMLFMLDQEMQMMNENMMQKKKKKRCSPIYPALCVTAIYN